MHVAFIMDGNRRWAKSRALPAFVGHEKWSENLEKLLPTIISLWINVVTVYALSTENLQRSSLELQWIFGILKAFCKKTHIFERDDISFRAIWNIKALPEDVQASLLSLQRHTSWFKSMIFQAAINYWWKDEIIRAINSIQNHPIAASDIESHLDTAWIPDPDLIIRTWGNQRISNFLMWQSAYSELYFTETFWPDFDDKCLRKAIEFFEAQKRNYGK